MDKAPGNGYPQPNRVVKGNPAMAEALAFRTLMPANLTYRFLADRGRPMTPLKKHPLNGTKDLGQCYKNSADEALWGVHGLHYCEGLAYLPKLIVFRHAWLCDDKGKVIDPTWQMTKGAKYFGVTFAREFVKDFLQSTHYYSIFESLHLFRNKSKMEAEAMYALLEGNLLDVQSIAKEPAGVS